MMVETSEAGGAAGLVAVGRAVGFGPLVLVGLGFKVAVDVAVGVLVGGIGVKVAVGGTFVAVAVGVSVGGIGVKVAVNVGVGGTAVGVSVGGTDVAVGAGAAGVAQPSRNTPSKTSVLRRCKERAFMFVSF
jgi:hypothetical protein